MSDFQKRLENLSPQRLMLLALELQSKIEGLEGQQTDPIAIVGMGCRIPTAEPGPEGFWELLEQGRDAITLVPPDRWDAEAYYDPDPDVPGRINTKWGGFLSDIAAFDASFFGISRREAASMDPQQRLLLEVCWEALEHAGYCPRKPAGGSAGVFIGLTTMDYHLLMRERGEDRLDAHLVTGVSHSIATGRIAYTLNLHGPNLTVDTACSASLTAIHLACQSLRANECRMALAGGVNALLSPELYISLTKAHVLSPDGRCKAFDSRADGFVRSEGCGIVVLKRMSDALADGDHILALIRGSALNQDGRSSGLTAPNGAAQEAVIRLALANARIAPEEVDFVEAHGTGTALGDPIEAHALGAVLGPKRSKDHPLVIGSVKTNLGHLESASGVIGLIKVVLALQHNLIPRHLHLQSINPLIDLSNLPFEIPVEAKPWVRSKRRRIAGLNSFGLSGTNAHAVVEEAPERAPRTRTFERPLHLLTLSARSDAALKAIKALYSKELGRASADLGDICFTAGAGRAHFEHRAAFIAETPEAMVAALDGDSAIAGSAAAAPQVVFLFPGQGAQYSGMCRELYETQPVFRETLDQCVELLRGELELPLLDVLWRDESHLLDETAYTQPALFAVEYALAKLWIGWGIQPAAVLGHSVGEYVAACIAGIFSLEDGLKLIAARGRLMQGVQGNGAMAAVMADEDRVRRALAGVEDRVTIAALNAPSNVVISGYRGELEHVQQALEKEGIRVQRLAVSHGFHSPQMREMEAAFEEVARTIRYHSPRLRVISSVTGREERDAMLHPEYWRRQVAQPVRFLEAVRTLEHSGDRIFLETGPGTTLAGLGRQCVTTEQTVWLPSLRKARGEWAQMLGSLAQLYVRGAEIDWPGFDKPYSRLRVPLPTYPFERQDHWFESRGAKRVPGGRARPADHIEDWFYKVAWEPQESQASKPAAAGGWLIVPDGGGIAAEFAKTLSRELGVNPVLVKDVESLAGHLRSGAFSFVVHTASLDHPTPQPVSVHALAKVNSGLAGVLAAARALVAEQGSARLWLVTSGAQPVEADGAGTNLLQTPVWGMGRTFALEHPESWGGLVDLDESSTPADAANALFSAIARNDGEDELSFHGGRRHVARLVRHNTPDAPSRFAPDRTYLITGGVGGLGLKLASWMADHGARNLLVLGRRAPSEEAARVLDQLRERGVRVEFRSADVTNKSQLDAVLSEVRETMPGLAGVIHAAGVLDDGVIAQLNPERIDKVLAPKVIGTWNLHQLTLGLPLDFFVMFSSLSSVTGSPGQASYAAANAFLDGFARYRKSLGLPAVSMNWGGWADAGMAARIDPELRQRAGAFRLMPSDRALDAFGRLVSTTLAQVTIASVDWDQLRNSPQAANAKPLLRSLLGQTQHRQDKAPSVSKVQSDGLRSLPPEALQPRLIAYLRDALASILGVEQSEIGPARPIVDYGLDSLMSLEFRNRIRTDLEITIPTARLLQGPTLEELAAEITPRLLPPGKSGDAARAAPVVEYPLSFSQQAQWFGHKLAPGSSTFNVAFTAGVSPGLDWSAFERAVAKLVDRHPALRTIVVETQEGQPAQRVLSSTTPDLTLIDATGWTEENLRKRVMEEFTPGFQIDRPMVRIRVFRTAGLDAMLFVVDHLVIDASSLQICFEDLRKLYPAELTGGDAGLKPLTADYHDFVKWEAEVIEGAGSERLWDYWKTALKGNLPVLRLPSSLPRPAVLLPKGETIPLTFGPELSAAVHRLARENRTTPYSLLLAAYQVLLKAWCGQDDMIVGTSVSRRDDPRWSDVVGFFVNVLAFRGDLSGDPTFADHLARTRESVLGGLTHQEFPFPMIVNRLRLPRSMSHNPVFQAFLNFLMDRSGELGGLMVPEGGSAPRFGDSTLQPFMIIPQQEGQSEIVLQLAQVKDQLVGGLNYNTDILDRATAEAMALDYLEILQNAVRDPNQPISNLTTKSSVEREEMFL